jgi:hypothetical protein
MILKVGAIMIGVILFIPTLIGNGVSGAISALFGSGGSQPSATALADIPADYLALYRAAAGVCPGLDWSILATPTRACVPHAASARTHRKWACWCCPSTCESARRPNCSPAARTGWDTC